MLTIYIGPNGFGKTTQLEKDYEELIKNGILKNKIIKLNAEIIFSDEMKDSVNKSFMLDYIVSELLETDEIVKARNNYEKLVDNQILENKSLYNESIEEVLLMNNMKREKEVLSINQSKEFKKLVSINSNEVKNKMGSGQRLQFLLSLIKKSNKDYIFLDEPENHTHPSLLHNTAKLINELSKNKNVTIATHSPELLSMLDFSFDNLYIFNDPKFGEPKKIDFNCLKKVTEKINIGSFNDKSKTYYDPDHLKKNIIELHKKEFLNCLFSKKVYIIEGLNDELFLKKALVAYNKQYEQYSIFCCYGKPHFLPFIEIFENINIIVVPIFDKDNNKISEDNNKIINNILMKKDTYIVFCPNVEEEIGYTGAKFDSIKFLTALDNYNFESKYKEVFERV